MQYGTKVNGRLEPRFIETADLTDAGKVYQVDIGTGDIVDEASAIEQLLTLEQQFPDLQIVYIETNRSTNTIQMQFTDKGPGQFSFTALLAAMPAILGIALIAVLAFTLWTVYASNPILLWALLALGAGVAFFYLTATQIRMPTAAIYKKEKTLEERDQRLKEQRLTYLETKLAADKAEKERKDAQAKLEADEKAKKKAEKSVKQAKKKQKEEKKQTVVLA